VPLSSKEESGGTPCTVHGLQRTFNNLSRQVAGNIVTRAITGHVTEEMTEHHSHVDRAEKLRAADQVVALAGSARLPTTTPRLPRPQVGDQVGTLP
jgi:integrase